MKVYLGSGSGPTARRMVAAGARHFIVSFARRAETEKVSTAVKEEESNAKPKK